MIIDFQKDEKIIVAFLCALGFTLGKIIVPLALQVRLGFRLIILYFGYSFFMCFSYFAIGRILHTCNKTSNNKLYLLKLLIIVFFIDTIINYYSSFVLNCILTLG